MISLSPTLRFFLYAHATDMRKSFDNLSGLVTSAYDDIFSAAGVLSPRARGA